MRIQFLGAAGTVTGSRYLLTGARSQVLLDCGLFQGYKQLRLRNWARLPIAPREVDAVVLTHAHLDHSGYLPLLVRDGFRGKIFCSEATFDLCKILLPDSGHLLEEEARYANRKAYSKHHPALPLYTADDAHKALHYFSPVPFRREFEVRPGIEATLLPAGHILGAAIVQMKADGTTITFSGDLGRPHDPIMVAPAFVERSDYLVVESTYGNRHHDEADPTIKLGQVIRDTAARGGVTIIPSFAVGRAQELMHYIGQLKARGEIPPMLPVYLNSPMAVGATAIYRRHRDEHRLDKAACEAMCQAATIVNSVDESIALNEAHMPMVIIAASGMVTGGRVLHHIAAYAPDPRNTILFSGYQAGGTRGAAMLAGAESIRMFGREIPLRAEVVQIDNLSAHADGGEIIDWLRHFGAAPKMTYITHGEPDAADALRRRITDELRWPCLVPAHGDSEELA